MKRQLLSKPEDWKAFIYIYVIIHLVGNRVNADDCSVTIYLSFRRKSNDAASFDLSHALTENPQTCFSLLTAFTTCPIHFILYLPLTEKATTLLSCLVLNPVCIQMDLHEANMRAGGPGQKPSPGQLGSPHEVNNLKQQLADAKTKIEGLEKQLDEKQKLIVELEGKLKVNKRIIVCCRCWVWKWIANANHANSEMKLLCIPAI